MRLTVVAASVAAVFVASPAVAVDFGQLFGPGGANHKDCAWSRPHIVFENNKKTGESYTLRRPDGTVVATVTVAPGKEEKVIVAEADRIYINQGMTLTFEECDGNRNYPAYRWTWKKDNSVEIHPRSK